MEEIINQDSIRINRYLSDCGVCSRRQADLMIQEGRVTVDGQTALMGQRITDGQQVCVDSRPVVKADKPVILLVNKPVGIVCTAEKREADNIVDFIDYPQRIYPVGRLDKNSHGLILMTNQGELVNDILRARFYHEKEYLVTVNKPLNDEFLENMRKGVYLEDLDVTTRPCRVEKLGKYRFRIVLTQGLNRQIRRMCRALDYHVRDLCRVRIMNLRLDGIALGSYRRITDAEYRELVSLLGDEKQD